MPDVSDLHIAAAFSVPLVSVYCDNPEQFAQWRPLHSGFNRVIFSKHRTSLEGYSSDELIQHALSGVNFLPKKDGIAQIQPSPAQ
jgi:ADP-heptose:LPS heptosyltransferase